MSNIKCFYAKILHLGTSCKPPSEATPQQQHSNSMGNMSRGTIVFPLLLVIFAALCVILDELEILKRLSPSFLHVPPPRSPRLALLITFPNSGTSYTMLMIQKVTQLAAGTNYVNEVSEYDSHPNVTIYPDHPEGPFWRGSSGTLLPLPNTTVLIKTHCFGYGLNTGNSAYKLSSKKFAAGCRNTAITSNMSQRGEYPSELVDRLVHIVRNPYDNMISRFHHEYNVLAPKVRDGNEQAMNWTMQHPKNQTGFRQFCQDLDADFLEQYKKRHFRRNLYDQIQKTICHDEVIQYVKWHNRAFDTSDIWRVPTLVIHYEDYEDNFNVTLSNLLEFLKLPRRDEPLTFESGHRYERDYFSNENRDNVKKLAKMLVSKKTWDAIERYFD